MVNPYPFPNNPNAVRIKIAQRTKGGPAGGDDFGRERRRIQPWPLTRKLLAAFHAISRRIGEGGTGGGGVTTIP